MRPCIGIEAGNQPGLVCLNPPRQSLGWAMLIGVDVDELQYALGGVVLESAYMERSREQR